MCLLKASGARLEAQPIKEGWKDSPTSRMTSDEETELKEL